MNNKGQTQGAVIIGILVLIAAVLAYFLFFSDGTNPLSTAQNTAENVNLAGCPTDGASAVTLNLYNALNTTGSEAFDASYSIFDTNDNIVATGTDTSAASVSLNCGETVILRVRSADGDEGDNARIINAEGSVGGIQIIEDGRAVKFTPSKDTATLDLYGSQHGVLQFKLYDNLQAAWIYDSGDASATDYETDGVTFESTTDNTTATAIGTDGKFDGTYYVQATRGDTEFGDFGVYILVEAPTSEYDEPVVKYEGTKLSDYKGQLDVFESRAWSSYEYVYFIPNANIQDDGVEVDFKISSLSGVNPSSDLEVDFASKGAVKEVAGSQIRYSGTNDASSSTVVYAVQDTTIDVS